MVWCTGVKFAELSFYITWMQNAMFVDKYVERNVYLNATQSHFLETGDLANLTD